MLQSSGQSWIECGSPNMGYDLRNQIVADVFYDNGKEFIKFTNDEVILVETAWRMGWERVLNYATN